MKFHKAAVVFDIEVTHPALLTAHKRNPKHIGNDPLIKAIKAIQGVRDAHYGSPYDLQVTLAADYDPEVILRDVAVAIHSATVTT